MPSAEILKHLSFDAQLMICKAEELIDLVDHDPFLEHASEQDVTRYISMLERRPRGTLHLPIYVPDGKDWQVAVIDVRGRFAASLHRRVGKTFVYPNEVIEKRFGMAATTRNWNTILTLRSQL